MKKNNTVSCYSFKSKPTQKGISIMPNNAGQIIEGILNAMEVMGFTKDEDEN